jgi:hypothetical protein
VDCSCRRYSRCGSVTSRPSYAALRGWKYLAVVYITIPVPLQRTSQLPHCERPSARLDLAALPGGARGRASPSARPPFVRRRRARCLEADQRVTREHHHHRCFPSDPSRSTQKQLTRFARPRTGSCQPSLLPAPSRASESPRRSRLGGKRRRPWGGD